MKTSIQSFTVLLIILLTSSCHQNSTTFFIEIDDYTIENNPQKPILNDIERKIQFICSTNFPEGTPIIIKKGTSRSATDLTILEIEPQIDTIIINKQKTIKINFSSTQIPGYVSFSTFTNKDETNDIPIYKLEYAIDYKKITDPAIDYMKIPIYPLELEFEKAN